MNKEQQIQLELDAATAKGLYSNFAVIFHNQNEFVLDFAFLNPQKGTIVSRIISNPTHAKRLMKALEQNVSQYEAQFGTIKEQKAPEPSVQVKLSQN